MKRAIWITLLAVVAFVGVLLARMPASWIIPAHSAHGGCASLDGSLWSGSCSGLTVGRTALGELSWELHPLKLFAGRLAAQVSLRGVANASGELELGLGQHVTARNLTAELPLDPRLVPGVPAELTGRAHLELALVEIEHATLTDLKGIVEVHDLEDHAGTTTPLGSYQLTFPGGGPEPVGKLRDLDGPLALEGTLRLTRQGGFDLQGMVAPRANAPPELVNNIRYFGSPDASGRRPFALSGTF